MLGYSGVVREGVGVNNDQNTLQIYMKLSNKVFQHQYLRNKVDNDRRRQLSPSITMCTGILYRGNGGERVDRISGVLCSAGIVHSKGRKGMSSRLEDVMRKEGQHLLSDLRAQGVIGVATMVSRAQRNFTILAIAQSQGHRCLLQLSSYWIYENPLPTTLSHLHWVLR